MSDNIITEQMPPEGKFTIPIRYGLMVGFIGMFLTTVSFLYFLKWNFIAFGISQFVMLIIPLFFYWLVASKQKSILGGSIMLKEAFQAIFIVIVISTLITSIYGLIYDQYIDPEAATRLKEKSILFFEKLKMPQDQLDEKIKEMEDRIAASTNPSILIYSIAQSILLSSIFGFIVALIVSRKKPQTAQ